MKVFAFLHPTTTSRDPRKAPASPCSRSTTAPSPAIPHTKGTPVGPRVGGDPQALPRREQLPLHGDFHLHEAEMPRFYSLQISRSFSQLLSQHPDGPLCTLDLPSFSSCSAGSGTAQESKIPQPCFGCASTDTPHSRGSLPRLLGGQSSAKILGRVSCPSNLPLFQRESSINAKSRKQQHPSVLGWKERCEWQQHLRLGTVTSGTHTVTKMLP